MIVEGIEQIDSSGNIRAAPDGGSEVGLHVSTSNLFAGDIADGESLRHLFEVAFPGNVEFMAYGVRPQVQPTLLAGNRFFVNAADIILRYLRTASQDYRYACMYWRVE